MVLQGVRFDRFERDRLTERVRATRARLRRADQSFSAEGVDAVRYGSDRERPRARVRAPQGRFEANTRESHLFGGVVVEDGQGRILEADSVTHDGVRDRLFTTTSVRVQGKDFVLDGVGFVLSPGEDRLKIGGPVEAAIEPGAIGSTGR